VKKIEDSQNGEGKFGSKGELLEFQVDIDKLPKHVHGDISDLGGAFEGNADKIIVYDKNALK
jgi:phosphomannomutase